MRRRTTARTVHVVAWAAALVLVAACSGGGSGSEPAPSAEKGSTESASTESASTESPGDAVPTSPGPDATTPATTTDGATGTPTTLDPNAAWDGIATPVDPVVGYLDEGGVLTLDGALALFAATYAPLPGVTPAGARPADSDTLVLSTLAAHRDDLTPEQAAVVDAVVGAAGAVEADDPSAGFRGVPDDRRAAALPIIDAATVHFAERLIRSRGLPVSVVSLPRFGPGGVEHFSGSNVAATATLLYGDDGAPSGCLIRLNTDAVYNSTLFVGQVAHEVFHCFQFSMGLGRPRWVLEGTAAYAGEEYTGGTSQSQTWWQYWARGPYLSLTDRSYDAIGLFALTAALGVDPYSYFDELYRSPGLAVVEAAAGAGLHDAWGVHYANEPSWGGRYTISGPGSSTGPLADRQAIRHTVRLLLDGGPAPFEFRPTDPAEAAQVYQLDAPGDVLSVAPNGASGGMRFGDGTEMMFSAQGLTEFCLAPGGCVCPGGTSAPTVPVASTEAFIGLGPSSVGWPVALARSLDEWCETPPPTTVAPVIERCEVGTWRSTSLLVPAGVGMFSAYTGGDGVIATFGADGSFRADYAGMTPVVSKQQVPSGPEVTTTFGFAGVLAGSWTVDDAGQLVVTADTSAVRVTADLTISGSTSRILDNTLAELADVAGRPGTLVVSVCDADLGTMEVVTAFVDGAVSMSLLRT